MTDWAHSGRTDAFTCHLVNPESLQDVREVAIDGAKCSLSWGYYTDNRLSGKVVLAEGDDFVDGEVAQMVRLRQKTTVDGQTFERVLATMFVKSAELETRGGQRTRTLTCYGPLYRYTQDELIDDFQCLQGRSIVEELCALATDRGGKAYVAPEVDRTRRHTVTTDFFELGTTVMSVLNTIAGWADLEITDTPWGEMRIGNYTLPRDKGSVYTYTEGRTCVRLPGVTRSDNRGDSRYNRVLAYYSRDSKEDGDSLPLADRAVAVLGDGSPFSYARCGRWASHVEKVTEACSHDSLQAKAERVLEDNSGSIEYVEIEAADVQEVSCGDAVTYVEAGTPVKCLVTQMETTGGLTPGMPVRLKMKVVG